MEHRAVVFIHLEVHEVNDRGENTGYLISSEDLAQYGLKSKMLKSITSSDKHTCLMKLKEAINAIS